MFEESPMSKRIFDFFDSKYGQLVAPIGLLKVFSIVSCHLNFTLPCLNVFHVAPTRQFKTQTAEDAVRLFPKEYVFGSKDDFTMFAIMETFKKEKKGIGERCIVVNDAAALFKSKSGSSRTRLVEGLTVLLADGHWNYGERLNPNENLIGHPSCIINMALEAYNKRAYGLLSSTFLERFLNVFYTLKRQEIKDYSMNKFEKIKQKMSRKMLRLQPKTGFEIVNYDDFKEVMWSIANDYSVLQFKSPGGCYDQLDNIVKVSVFINGRKKIVDDDMNFLKMLKSFLFNPMRTDEITVLRHLKDGRSYQDIQVMMGKSYKFRKFIARVQQTAVERGILENAGIVMP